MTRFPGFLHAYSAAAFLWVVLLTTPTTNEPVKADALPPCCTPLTTANADDKKVVARLDTEYQAAVKANYVATMDRLLADDFVLRTGAGKSYTKSDLLNEARSGDYVYEHQEDTEQSVHVWGDTAVVSAKLWEKGTNKGKPFDYTVWFSDTYVRTPTGWRYVFGQSSLPLPKSAS